MAKLCMKLPPFSPDYSGVCSTLFPWDTLTVIHDASGCTGNYTGYDEPRWFHSRAPIYCSGLREIDAILGDDEKLIQKVLYALEDVKPEMIALVGSPVPMVIGTDMEGIAAEIEDRTGIMSFGFDTTGIGYYPEGIAMVYKKVIQRILEESDAENECQCKGRKTNAEEEHNDKISKEGSSIENSNKQKKLESSVNIIGATPIDFGKSNTLEELEQLLVDNGITINVSLWKKTTKQDITRLKQGACNIVVSHAGVELAKYMEKRYGIPYVTGLPYGEKYAGIWIEKLKELFVDSCLEEDNTISNKTECESTVSLETESSILIIGEQFQSDSIRKAIEAEYGINCDIAGICGWSKEFAREQDRFLESEEEIEVLLNDEKYDLIIGDPLYKTLLHSEKKYLEYPHYAVSSKLANEKAKSFIGKKVELL